MNDMTIMMNEYYVIVINQCRCLPKAELNTKTNPNGHHSVAVWVRFGVQLDYSCRLKSASSIGEKCVRVRRRNGNGLDFKIKYGYGTGTY